MCSEGVLEDIQQIQPETDLSCHVWSKQNDVNYWNFRLDQISHVTSFYFLGAEGLGKGVRCGNVPVKNNGNKREWGTSFSLVPIVSCFKRLTCLFLFTGMIAMQPRRTSCHVRRQTNVSPLRRSCYHKDDNGKLWVEVIIVTFCKQ